jgi:hypothetical protein
LLGSMQVRDGEVNVVYADDVGHFLIQP